MKSEKESKLKNFEIPVIPLAVKQAREVLGYSAGELAKRLKISVDKLLDWEVGKLQPSFSQLEKLSTVLNQPLSNFLVPNQIADISVPRDFRTRNSNEMLRLSPKSKLEIADAQNRQSIISSLRKELGLKPIVLPRLSATEEVRSVAFSFRQQYGPRKELQFRWALDKDTLVRDWRTFLESLGVMVFRLSLDTTDVSGFCLHDDYAPVIAISSDDFPTRSVFTLFHELAHLMQGHDATCNDFFSNSSRSTQNPESLSNTFSAEFLVPENLISLEIQNVNFRNHRIELEKLSELADKFGVSKEVILVRLLEMKRVSRAFYEEWKDLNNKPFEKPFRRKSGFPVKNPHQRKVANKTGRLYASLVLQAHQNRIITLSEASEYLGVQAKQVPGYYQILAKQQSLE